MTLQYEGAKRGKIKSHKLRDGTISVIWTLSSFKLVKMYLIIDYYIIINVMTVVIIFLRKSRAVDHVVSHFNKDTIQCLEPEKHLNGLIDLEEMFDK